MLVCFRGVRPLQLIIFEKYFKCTCIYTNEKEIHTIRIFSSVSFSVFLNVSQTLHNIILPFLTSQQWDTQRIPSWGPGWHNGEPTGGDTTGETQRLQDFDRAGTWQQQTAGRPQRALNGSLWGSMLRHVKTSSQKVPENIKFTSTYQHQHGTYLALFPLMNSNMGALTWNPVYFFCTTLVFGRVIQRN
jgi:hypothetical protein